MKPSILITREIFAETIEHLRQHFEVVDNQGGPLFSATAMAAQLADKQGVLVVGSDKIDAAMIAGSPQLKAIANASVGYNNVDVGAATARRIMVTNTPGVLTDTTADTTWALILAAARRVTELEAWLRAGKWDAFHFTRMLGRDVHHATLGVLGMGRIGQAVAKRARGFEMKVLYSDTVPIKPEIERECNASFVSKEQLLREADFISLHMPYTPENHHMIGAKELASMKPTAVLINAARGGIVDEIALADALRYKRLYAAGLDVFENEPSVRKPLLELDNVVLLPHVGSATEATRRAMAQLAAHNLIAAMTGATPPNLVNPEVKR